MFRGLLYSNAEVTFVNYLALGGDANGDMVVDVQDLNIWNANKLTTAFTASYPTAIPEPAAARLTCVAFCLLGGVLLRR